MQNCLNSALIGSNFDGVFVEPTAYDALDASTHAAEAKDALSFGENRPVTSVWYVIFPSIASGRNNP